jgi:hypothetical protein
LVNKGGIKMASVTQCDVCNNVIKHEESKYIKIYNVDKYDNTTTFVEKELCPQCYEKVAKILKIK